ncbi:MAG: ArnT family glycosyltransferase [Rhizobiaceae bacterium]
MLDRLRQLASAGGRRGHAARIAFLVMLALVCFVPGISGLPPTDRDESRYMQATKQMVATGDYIDIRFQENPRYLKPIGAYWLQSVAVHIFGDGEATRPWVYRLVSIFGAVSAVVLTYLAGFRILGTRAGLAAALMLTGMVAVGFEARIAKTDAILLAATMAAMTALAHVYLGLRQGRSFRPVIPWLFWLGIGAGILIKGPITPMLAALTVAALCWWDRDWRWTKALRPRLGALVLLVIAAPWFIVITWKSGLAFWNVSLGKDAIPKVSSGQESHGFPPGYYFATFALFLWPFGLHVLSGLLKGMNALRGDPRLVFLFAWFAPFWILFEIIPTKLPHYVLPTYPAMALLAAWAIVEGTRMPLNRWQVWLTWIGRAGWAIVTLFLAAAALILLPYVVGAFSLWGLVAAMLILAAAWLGSGYYARIPALPRIAAATLSAGLATGIVMQVLAPGAKPFWLGERIAETFIQHRPCPDSVLASSAFHEPSLVFLAGTKTVLTDPAGAAVHLAADPLCAVAVVQDDQRPAFLAAMPHGEAQIITEFTAVDYTKGIERTVTLYRVAGD